MLSVTGEGFRAVAVRCPGGGGGAAGEGASAGGASDSGGPGRGAGAGAGRGPGAGPEAGPDAAGSEARDAASSRGTLIAEGASELGRAFLDGLQRLAGLRAGRPAGPSGGYFRLALDGSAIDVELTVVPAVGGEHAALEVCSRCAAPRGLADLGLEPGDLARLRGLLAERAGLIAVTGEAGSGRSTAYSALIDTLAGSARRVVALQRSVTAPDPRVTCVRLPEGDLYPPEAWIDAAERLAPDVLALDDIASVEATTRAVRAALGGVLVVQVRAEEDAVGAARALESLALERGAVGAALLGILAVRLVRRLCPACAQPSPPPIELGAAVRALGGPAEGAYAEGTGCPACGFTGTHGVAPLFELVAPDAVARSRLVEARGAHDLSAFAAEGRQASIRAQAARLAAAGEIPVRELARIL